MRFLVAALLLSSLFCGAGCGASGGDAQRATLLLFWRFADGRLCAEAGALQVDLTMTSASSTNGDGPNGIGCDPANCELLCSDGEGSSGVTISVPASDVSLALVATSPMGDALYRGTLMLDAPVPSTATAILYFTGGK